MDPRVTVNYACQRCHHPIQLNSGFSNINQHTHAELALPIYRGETVDFTDIKVNKLVQPLKLTSLSGLSQGFTLIGGETGDTEKTHTLKIATGLFDLVSSNSDVDHPLCEECTDTVLDAMDEQLRRSEKQVQMYQQLLTSLDNLPKPDVSALEEELSSLKLEEKRLIGELEEVKKEQEAAKNKVQQCEEERARLETEDDRYWREFCSHKCQYTFFDDQNKSLRIRLNYSRQQLEKLRQMNVFNATFHLWHCDHFGTINGLRLGRLPTVPVPWQEINAAWGQTVLLLSSLARKIGLTFTKYKLIPYGNSSYVEVINENKELPLYGSGGLRFLWDNKFDAGMVAFLECLAEFQNFVENREVKGPRFHLPYGINKHFIVDKANEQTYSVKMQFNSEENWTKALKFLLTNLKWGLTWVSSSLFCENT